MAETVSGDAGLRYQLTSAVGLAWDISLPRLGHAKEVDPAAAVESPVVLTHPTPAILPQEGAGD